METEKPKVRRKKKVPKNGKTKPGTKRKKRVKKKSVGDTKTQKKTTKGKGKGKAKKKKVQKWECIGCTFKNPNSRTTCEMCETKRDGGGSESASSEEEWGSDYQLDSEEYVGSDSDIFFLDDEVTEEPMFKILTLAELEEHLDKLITDVGSELGMNKYDAALLLQHFGWSVSKLQAQYWDRKNKVCKAAGLKKVRKKKLKKEERNKEVECLVCCDDVKLGKTITLGCGHGPYCPVCWENHLEVVVANCGAEGIINSKCMWPRCEIKINHKMFEKLANKKTFERYHYFYVKNFVDCTNKFSWCPNPNCDNVAMCKEDVGRPAEVVHCTCGRQFCFACGWENHNPINCEQLRKWQDRNSDDQESIKLVMATSKQCHHCGIPTTRIDGCNHMTCRKEKGGCGGEWCWMCRGDWKTHGEHTGGFYSCNKYEASDAKKLDDKASSLKADADRYLHYFNRYFGHETGCKATAALREKALVKARQYRNETSGNELFFTEAVDLLARCRQILKFTYVYGYYIPDGSKGKEFFEFLQANAEGITERLADQVNCELSELNITDFKNRIRVTKKYIDNLVRGIEEGLDMDSNMMA